MAAVAPDRTGDRERASRAAGGLGSPLRLGLAVLAFCLLAGFALQAVVLPALPSIHAGNGILANTDPVAFHADAVALAAAIRERGWDVWTLRPDRQAPVGLSAAVYVLTGIDRPMVFLPVSAALFALGAAALLSALRACGPDRAAVAGTLPFFLFPSAAQLYGQVHKDAFSIAGYLLVLAAWILLAARGPIPLRRMAVAVALVVAGCLLVWTVRPFMIPILFAASALAAALVAVLSGRGRPAGWWATAAVCLLVPVAVRILLPSTIGEFPMPPPPDMRGWGVLDRFAVHLSLSREAFVVQFPGAGSNIDVDVRFASVADVLAHLPRALQVGLLAPFPDQWTGAGHGPASGIMRLVAAGETMIVYALLAGVPFLLLLSPRDRVPILVVLAFAVTLIVVLALAVPNVGSLYRMRHAGLHAIVGLGVLGWAALLARR